MTVSRKGEWFNLQRLSYTMATDKSPATLRDKLANGTLGSRWSHAFSKRLRHDETSPAISFHAAMPPLRDRRRKNGDIF
jgi:hypothetical protein